MITYCCIALNLLGQRYHVIVEAKPSNGLIPVEDQNYWIRITAADGCDDIEEGQKNEKLGIIRYNSGSTKKPTTLRYKFDKTCADEPYESLVPVVKIDVTARDHPANNSKSLPKNSELINPLTIWQQSMRILVTTLRSVSRFPMKGIPLPTATSRDGIS